jgi:hypothetical protein
MASLSGQNRQRFSGEMNATLAELRHEREKRQANSESSFQEPPSHTQETSSGSGAKRRKQSAPRRIVRESEEALREQPNDAIDIQTQSKKKRGDGASEQKDSGRKDESIDLTEDEPDLPKKKRSNPTPKDNKGKAKKPQPASSIEFEAESGPFDVEELARTWLS